MRVVIVAGGDVTAGDGAWLDRADVIVAADAGASALARLGRRPDRLVGDLDSVPSGLVAELTAAGVAVERHPADKNASDTELALDAALASGATEIRMLGALGGPRVDHELANVLLLADEAVATADVRIVRGNATVRVLHGPATLALEGAPGDLVTLLPIGGDAHGVSTEGLHWALDAATLRLGRSRGLSNRIDHAGAAVTLATGALLVIETAARVPAP